MLGEAARLGLVGGDSIEDHLSHSLGYAELVADAPVRALDLGSGGGLPGLVLATQWPGTSFVLLDSSERRCRFLGGAIERLAIGDRARVLCQRAEAAGRDQSMRGSFELVVARSFGPPAVTAECSAPFLSTGGRLIVSDPPAPTEGKADLAGSHGRPHERWPPAGLDLLGLSSAPARGRRYSYQVMVQVRPCPDRYPRRVGVPAKKPLF